MLTALLCVLGVAYVGVAGAVHGRLKNKHDLDHFASFLLAAAWPAVLPYSSGFARVNDRFLEAAAAERRGRLALMEHSGELDPNALARENQFTVVCACGYRSCWHDEDLAKEDWTDHALACEEGVSTRLWRRQSP